MTHAAGTAAADDSPILHAAIGLAEQIRVASDEIETGRRLPESIAAAMKEAGVFSMAMPRVWGGPELDPLTQIRVIEALALADGSVGWCAMIGCDSGYVSAFLDQDVGRAMYPDLLVATGAAATTTGQALRVPSGYRVSGRFPFVSGCHHGEWAWLGCTVIEDGAAEPGPFAMMATADEREASADPITARHSQSLSGRRRGGAGGNEQVGIHRAADILIEEGGDVAAVAADHSAPSDGAVGQGKRLDHANLCQRVQFRTAPNTRHRHAEDAGFFHRRGNRLWKSAARFDLVACHADLFRESDCSMQDRGVVRCCCSCCVCHR